jgi:hypothetical protein
MIVLYILSIFAALIILFLFVPVTYSVDISDRDDIYVKILSSWLFRLLSVSFIYTDAKPFFTFRILGIRVMHGKKERNKNTGAPKTDKPNKNAAAVQEMGGKINELLTDQTGKINISSLQMLIKDAWDVFKPRKVKAEAVVGFNNPAETSFFLGMMAVISNYYNLHRYIRITGDFINRTLIFNIFLTGRFNVKSLIGLILRINAVDSKYISLKDEVNG